MGQDYFVFKTSFAQERLWFLDQFAPGNPYYNIHVALPLGEAAPDVVRRSLQEIVRRHEALRTTFVAIKGEPVQAVAPALDLAMPVVDLRGRPAAECDQALAALSREQSVQAFDLATGPLLRTVFVHLDHADAVLLLTMHHIVSDGWSMDVLTRELGLLYDAFASGRPSPLPDLPIQYADFAVWQRDWLRGDVIERQLAYWRRQLASAPPCVEMPTDRPRPPVQTYAGAYQATSIPPTIVQSFRQHAQREGATMFMALAAAFALLVHRYTGQDDVVFGTPIANRHRPEVQDLIGLFVNTLTLRIDVGGQPDFRALLRRTREVALGAYQHQDLPFEQLVAELGTERHLSHTPIFQIMFVHQTRLEERPVASGPHPAIAGAAPQRGLVERGTAKFDLTLFTSETEAGELAAVVEYNTDLFDDARITRLLGHFETLVAAVAAQADLPVDRVPLLTAEEQAGLTVLDGRRTAYPRDTCVHDLVLARASERPHAIAVVCEDATLTYEALAARATSLAHRLHAMGAGPDVPVAVCLERSVDLIVVLLGVLGAGAAYVPLDPTYPASRLAFMLEDTGAPILVTRQHLLARLPERSGTQILLVDEASDVQAGRDPRLRMPDTGVAADHLAYIMYTSGSTGRPKGVAVPHRGIVRLVVATDYVTLGPDDIVLHFAPVSFDASTFEIWGALLNGARLVVCPPGPLAMDALGAIVEREAVTTVWLTASVFQEVVAGDLDAYRSVRQLLAGGDVLRPGDVRRAREALPGCRLINGYGPTEATTFTCCHTITDEDCTGGAIPIGRPIANTVVRVLDRHLEPVPVGNPGELFIGGDGLARGYWRRDDLTAERFVPDSRGGVGARLYRTGDLVRYRESGVVEFLGRRDHQVKVRGFRIELGEVEAAVLRHPAVHAALVSVREEGSAKRLEVHVAADASASVTVGGLRQFLLTELPDYMVPSAFVISDHLPLTPAGKVDREAVIHADEPMLARDLSYAAPTTTLEHAIARVWQQVLTLDRVGVTDNFFELGGQSLLMVRAQRQLQDVLGVPLTLVELFQYPTIRGLAEHVGGAGTATPDPATDERAARRRDARRQQATARTRARGLEPS